MLQKWWNFYEVKKYDFKIIKAFLGEMFRLKKFSNFKSFVSSAATSSYYLPIFETFQSSYKIAFATKYPLLLSVLLVDIQWAYRQYFKVDASLAQCNFWRVWTFKAQIIIFILLSQWSRVSIYTSSNMIARNHLPFSYWYNGILLFLDAFPHAVIQMFFTVQIILRYLRIYCALFRHASLKLLHSQN